MAHLGEDAPEDDDRDDSRDRPDPRQAEESEVAYEEPRRDLLPDIEEINSTLKSSRGGKQADEARHRSGFRAGFMVMLLASLALVFAYAQAPAIARALPEAEPAMIGFVDLANQLRDWIDGLIGG